MDRKLTILDWGLFKLQSELDDSEIDASVHYRWDENKIIIETTNFSAGSEDKTMEQTKSDCELIFSKIDKILWIRDGTDSVKVICRFCNYFSHNGFTTERLNEAQIKIKDRLYYSYIDLSNSCERKAYGKSVAISSY